MLKKIPLCILWFIFFGLSFLIESWGWTEQGKAFIYMELSFSILIVLIAIVIIVIDGLTNGAYDAKANGLYFKTVLIRTGFIAITLFATWVATKIFNINFDVAYQLMTFGQYMHIRDKKTQSQ